MTNLSPLVGCVAFIVLFFILYSWIESVRKQRGWYVDNRLVDTIVFCVVLFVSLTLGIVADVVVFKIFETVIRWFSAEAVHFTLSVGVITGVVVTVLRTQRV